MFDVYKCVKCRKVLLDESECVNCENKYIPAEKKIAFIKRDCTFCRGCKCHSCVHPNLCSGNCYKNDDVCYTENCRYYDLMKIVDKKDFVKTNIGEMPVGDYLDILAIQYGFTKSFLSTIFIKS